MTLFSSYFKKTPIFHLKCLWDMQIHWFPKLTFWYLKMIYALLSMDTCQNLYLHISKQLIQQYFTSVSPSIFLAIMPWEQFLSLTLKTLNKNQSHFWFLEIQSVTKLSGTDKFLSGYPVLWNASSSLFQKILYQGWYWIYNFVF